MSTSGEPITTCPACRYDLTGLPKNHICPECAFEYDETMRAWYTPKPPRHLLAPGFFLFVILPLGGLSAISYEKTGSFLVPTHVLWRVVPLTYMALLPLILFFAGTIWMMGRRPPFIIIADDGLYIRMLWSSVKRFPWSELSLRGWLVRRLEADGESACTDRYSQFQRWLGRYHLLGLWWSFLLLHSHPGKAARTVQLPIVAKDAAARDRFIREIYDRWVRATAAASGTSLGAKLSGDSSHLDTSP